MSNKPLRGKTQIFSAFDEFANFTQYPDDKGLQKQVRTLDETQSAFTVIKEEFFPNKLPTLPEYGPEIDPKYLKALEEKLRNGYEAIDFDTNNNEPGW